MPSTSLELCAGKSDSDVVQQGIQTISECKLQCVTTPACKAIEFVAVGGTCKLLTGPDSWKLPVGEGKGERDVRYLLAVLFFWG